jgi:large subunit ribosomal protein L19
MSMTDLIRRVTFEKAKNKKTLPEFHTGDTVGVYVRLKEGEKERVQLYRGVVIKIQGSGIGRSFTVRKISAGVGVERTFPLASPAIDRVEVISHGKVRRSRLFYLRGLKGRSARLETKAMVGDEAEGAMGAADEVATEEKATAAAAEPKAPKADKKAEKTAK